MAFIVTYVLIFRSKFIDVGINYTSLLPAYYNFLSLIYVNYKSRKIQSAYKIYVILKTVI